VSDDPLPGVSQTAIGVALIRAGESARADRLFDDPYARAFVEAAPEFLAQRRQALADQQGISPLGALIAFYSVIRTRYFDDYLRTATEQGCRQVVLLAAGLDTRAYRLDWPAGTRLFELDLPQLLAFKQRVLAAQDARPRCERIAVAADLREDWPGRLVEAGFDPEVPTAWLAEGLLIYLSGDEAAALLTSVGNLCAPGSQLSFEHSQFTPGQAAEAEPSMRRYTRLWQGGLGPDAENWLAGHGWLPRADDRRRIAEQYRRSAPPEARGTFLTAVRA